MTPARQQACRRAGTPRTTIFWFFPPPTGVAEVLVALAQRDRRGERLTRERTRARLNTPLTPTLWRLLSRCERGRWGSARRSSPGWA
jgi:hypothetical protein